MIYSELLTLIQEYLENDETSFVNNIPNFVKMAEKRIFDEAQLLVSRKNATSTITTSQQYLQAPSDFLAPFSMAIVVGGSHSYLTFVDESFVREAYPSATSTGRPRHYAMFDHDTFLLGPTSDATYTVELHYFNYPESIVTASSTWLGTNADNALLYGSLIEAYRYMKGDEEKMKQYSDHFSQSVASLKIYSAGRSRGDAYRFGQFRVPLNI